MGAGYCGGFYCAEYSVGALERRLPPLRLPGAGPWVPVPDAEWEDRD